MLLRVPLLCSMLLLLAASRSCVPEQVVWRGDDLVYCLVEGKSTHLKRLDAAGKSHTLAVGLPFTARTPALSPDGTQIAVVRAEGDAHRVTVRVLRYDSAGKFLGESDPWEWVFDEEANKDTATDTLAWWSPEGDRLLVATGNEFAAYHFKDQTFRRYSGVKNSLFVTLVLNSPVLPDGTGFLAEPDSPLPEGDGERDQLVLVDWDGNLRPVAESKEVQEQFEGEEGASDILPLGATWVMGEYRFHVPGGYAAFNYAEGKFNFLPDEPAARRFSLAVRARAKAFAVAPNGEAVLLARPVGSTDSPQEILRVTVAEGVEEVLVPRAAPAFLTVEFHPSPDGRRLAVQYRDPESEARRLLMLDAAGKKLFDAEL